MRLLREAGSTARLEMAQRLTRSTIELSRRAIARAEPGLSEDELAVRFVALCYGGVLAAEFQRHLASRPA